MDARHIDDRPEEGYTPGTTHASWGAGDPRLRITRDDERDEYRIESDVVRIGSAEGSDLRLADTDAVHATITHDDRDEYVLEMHGAGEMSASSGVDGTHIGERTGTLRTGARFTMGPWTLVFARDEYADHGRPYGGRLGGEYSDQPLQPPRPDYSGDAADHQRSGTPSARPVETQSDSSDDT